MSSITPISNPLMQPVQYMGQTYFTGQYFHQMYRNNSDTNGKYKQASHFVRLIRSIETYQNYVNDGDIVELNWKEIKESGIQNMDSLKELFKTNSYNPIMLINATAQVALTALQQAKTAPALLIAFIEAGKALGTDQAMARAVAVDQVRNSIGIDFTPLLTNNNIDEAPVTPTELGKELGISGRKINAELETYCFQARNDDGNWMPTEKGKPFCTVNPYKAPNSDHTGYRVLWYKKVLDELTKAA
jgi:hypothetical protein